MSQELDYLSQQVALGRGSRRDFMGRAAALGLSAAAVGAKHGASITFNLNEKQSVRGGNPVKINSILELSGKQITVDFAVEFNQSGQLLTTTVPFHRQ